MIYFIHFTLFPTGFVYGAYYSVSFAYSIHNTEVSGIRDIYLQSGKTIAESDQVYLGVGCRTDIDVIPVYSH